MGTVLARALVLVGLLASTTASAADDPADPWYRRPYAATRVIGGGSPDLFGASGSLYLPRPMALEVGVSRSVGDRGSVYGRVGPALSLRERPDAPVDVRDARFPTFDVLVQPMVGYRWVEVREGEALTTFGGPTFAVAGDLMIWVNAKVALDFQLSIGGDYWLQRSDPDALAFAPDVHLAAGFAF